MHRTSSLLILVLAALLLAGCNTAPAVSAGASSQLPTATNTFSIDLWRVASPTEIPVPEPPLGASPTLPPPTATSLSVALPPTVVPTDNATHTPEPNSTPKIDALAITTLLFTGSIVPGRCVQAAVDEHGNADFLYDDVRDLITDADVAVGTLNASISDFPPHTGCVETFVLTGGANNADALARAGFDVMSVATNHIKNCGPANCGDRAFLDTLENLQRVGIEPVGGGKNLAEALQPVVVTVNGIRFGIVSLGEIEEQAFATENTPGIAVLNNENLRASIAAAREVTDVVIVMPHWGSDYSFTPNPFQLQYAQTIIDAGSDLVVGNHSHVIQGMQTIEEIPVFYSLGSFVFDQTWLPPGYMEPVLQQGLILRVTFQGTKIAGYDLIPVHITDDKSGHVQVAPPLEAADILARFEEISQDLN